MEVGMPNEKQLSDVAADSLVLNTFESGVDKGVEKLAEHEAKKGIEKYARKLATEKYIAGGG